MDVTQMLSVLQSLYAKRGELDKQIQSAQKKFVEAAKLAAKVSGGAKELAAKKPALKAAAKNLLKM